MRLNFNPYQHFVSFSGEEAKKRKQHKKITADPQLVQKMYMQDGLKRTGLDLGVNSCTVKNYLKRHNLWKENKRPNRTFTLLEDRMGVTVEDVKSALLNGSTLKEIIEYYGFSYPIMKRFLDEHKDEIDFRELKKQAQINTFQKAANAMDAGNELDINIHYATILRKKYTDDERSLWDQRREARLKIEIPLFEQHIKRKEIARQAHCSKRTVLNDYKYYLAQQQKTKEEN